MKSNMTDMTSGSPAKHILLFALPTLIGNIFQQVYNLADSIIVGRFVGKDAFAAIGATGSITFLFFALCNGIGGGGGIIVSQYYGAHDDEHVKKCIFNTGIIMLIAPLIFGLTGFLLAPALLTVLGTPETIMNDSVMYIRYMCFGLLFVSLYNFISSVLKALGDSKTPLLFLIISTIINIILDILFVCYFKLGIAGAAIATVVSQMLSALLCGIFAFLTNPYFKFRNDNIHFNPHMCYRIIRLGVPLSLQFGLIAISSMAVQKIVNSFGTIVVAAFTATNRIEQLIHQPYTTLGSSLSTYSGQNFGAGRNDRVYKGYKTGVWMMGILTVVLFVSMQLLGRFITSLFVEDTEVIRLGAMGLRITSYFYFTLGMIYVVRGVLTGIGDALFQLINGIVEVIGRFTVPILMTKYMGFGSSGIWISAGIVWAISAFTAWLRYYSFFKKKHILKKETQA